MSVNSCLQAEKLTAVDSNNWKAETGVALVALDWHETMRTADQVRQSAAWHSRKSANAKNAGLIRCVWHESCLKGDNVARSTAPCLQ